MSQIYYFAYGSNMNSTQMTDRCPESSYFGTGVLRGYRLTERLFADIDAAEGECVHGVVYDVTDNDLKKLDGYEGVHSNKYRRFLLDIECNGRTIPAYVYEMTEQTKKERDGKPYADAYRKKCSDGAVKHGIPDEFLKD